MFFEGITTHKACIKIELSRREWVTVLSMAFYLFYILGLLSTNPLYFHNLKCFGKRMQFFCRRTHAQNEHGFTFLEAMKVHMKRIQSFCKLKMLRHAQIHSVVSQMPQKSDSAIFYKRKRYTTVFLKEFFPKNGGGPGGPTQAQSACHHFLEKSIFIEKSFCVPFAFVKNETAVF